jgi:hypothetical protein
MKNVVIKKGLKHRGMMVKIPNPYLYQSSFTDQSESSILFNIKDIQYLILNTP